MIVVQKDLICQFCTCQYNIAIVSKIATENTHYVTYTIPDITSGNNFGNNTYVDKEKSIARKNNILKACYAHP